MYIHYICNIIYIYIYKTKKKRNTTQLSIFSIYEQNSSQLSFSKVFTKVYFFTRIYDW